MYLVFTRMPGESYRRRLGSLLYLWYVLRALINSLVCCSRQSQQKVSSKHLYNEIIDRHTDKTHTVECPWMTASGKAKTRITAGRCRVNPFSFNTPQPPQDEYIFLCHRLTVNFSCFFKFYLYYFFFRFEEGAYPENLHTFCIITLN